MLLKLEGPRLLKIIVGPFYLIKWRGPTLLSLYSEPKTGGARSLPVHSKTTPLEVPIVYCTGYFVVKDKTKLVRQNFEFPHTRLIISPFLCQESLVIHEQRDVKSGHMEPSHHEEHTCKKNESSICFLMMFLYDMIVCLKNSNPRLRNLWLERHRHDVSRYHFLLYRKKWTYTIYTVSMSDLCCIKDNFALVNNKSFVCPLPLCS